MEPSLKIEKPLENGNAKGFDFAEKVDQSKQVIHNKVQENIAKQERKTRGGSRPGAGRKRLSEAQTGPHSENNPNQDRPIAQTPDISIYIAPPLVAISKIPAVKHGIPELALSPEEALACAQSLNGILTAFVPDTNQMDPKTAAILGCLVTVGSIGFQKYMIYLDKKKPIATAPEEIQDDIAKDQAVSGVTSEGYFKRTMA